MFRLMHMKFHLFHYCKKSAIYRYLKGMFRERYYIFLLIIDNFSQNFFEKIIPIFYDTQKHSDSLKSVEQ